MKIESSANVDLTTFLWQVEPWLRTVVREEVTGVLEHGRANLMKDPMPDLCDSKRVAEYLGISEVTLWRLRKDGRIGFFRIGSRVAFSIDEHVRPFLDKAAARNRRKLHKT